MTLARTCTRVALAAGATFLVVWGFGFGAAHATTATGSTPYLWQKCSHVHTRYKHGVGRNNARDHTKSGTNPVTNFYRSTRVYKIAMHWNSRLDADKDGIACEAH